MPDVLASGLRVVFGFNQLVMGQLDDPYVRKTALDKAVAHGFGDGLP